MSDQSNEKPDSSEQPESSSTGIVIAAIAMGACCIGPVLFATVGFSAMSAWFFDSGILWLVFGVATVIGLYVLYRRGVQNNGRPYTPSSDSKKNLS